MHLTSVPNLQLDPGATPQLAYRPVTRAPALLALICLIGLSACERPGERASERALTAKVLEGVLAFPQSTLLGVSAGSDAGQATFTTPAAPGSVAAWYRQALKLNGWQIRTDQAMPDGSISIYAEQGTRSLWITLQANVGAPGTTYTLVGAIRATDTTAGQRSGSSMSSNRIQRR